MSDQPIVTFLSDFGTIDGYVGSVKGVIKSLVPNADIVDISHAIAPYDVKAASFSLLNYYEFYPKNTVHLVVVDPGVGSERRPVILKTAHHTFVGPDNGVFRYIQSSEAYSLYEVDVKKLPEIKHSETFQARDIFAPIVGMLLRGATPEKLGRKLDERTEIGALPYRRVDDKFEVEVLSVDRFGNIITGFSKRDMERLKRKKISKVSAKDFTTTEISHFYAEKEEGELLVLWNSQNFLEIASNQGNAVQKLDLDPESDRVLIWLE